MELDAKQSFITIEHIKLKPCNVSILNIVVTLFWAENTP